MNGRQPQTALRELRRHFASPVTLGTLLAISAMLTLVAPFGTDASLPLGGRALYWSALVLATYATGYAVDVALRPRLAHRVAQAVLPLAIALAVTLIVIGVNRFAFGSFPDGDGRIGDVLTIFAVAALAAGAVQMVSGVMDRSRSAPETAAPAILDRLPLDKRGALVALSVEDHYVRVRTVKGEDMLLMRLSDAIRETAPEPGLRVHRSHWVATAAVRAARREGDRAILSMSAGGDIPVSRSHMPAVKDAGLLPR
ncbi:LytTR family transcriptional regulator [Roseibacterium sp. SDUM158016]|uniref:LytTR family DNA-binding domain-containing protein n=1 Tax=Roseicyclus sediminis TaxID=2980997 RepID=UPI0021D36DF6|nr:LytTR family DNA-binding domain-containing protein [Roseibacterium sp. SDUM158016]MCU4652620.1 LytTR family transcriptional regulator [Roseibacterium sp. SDUM158016]